MNIGEANAVNVLLRALMGEDAGERRPDAFQLADAAGTLAAKANRVLGAGLTGPQIRQYLLQGEIPGSGL